MSSFSLQRPSHRLFDLDRCIDEAFSRLIHEPWGPGLRGGRLPVAVDVYETDDAYVVYADLPGVAPADLGVQVESNRVTLTGHRQSLSWQVSERSLCVERSAGEFRRTVSFAQPIDGSAVEQQFEQGILRIWLPKQRERGVPSD